MAAVAVMCMHAAGVAAGDAPAVVANGLFATVGSSAITRDEYDQALQQASRRRFYHGAPPEGALEQLRHDVARELITRQLLLQEAARLGLSADAAVIRDGIAAFENRYAGSPRWQTQRAELVEVLTRHYREEDLLRQLEAHYRKVAPPDRAQILDYYGMHQDRFTEPARQRVSLILLQVDPASPGAIWDAAMQDGARLVEQLADGADFAALARLHSADASSRQGGDMGYLHTGMLSPAADELIAGLAPGEVSEPIRLLEGVAILRLDERKPARLRNFEEAGARARELWLREQGDLAWQHLQDSLWARTPITVHDELLALDIGK